MKQTARAVVIGGGVGGASILYWLTRLGWADVVLVERSRVTSGSTVRALATLWSASGTSTCVTKGSKARQHDGASPGAARQLEIQFSLGAFDAHLLALDLHLDFGGNADRLFSNS